MLQTQYLREMAHSAGLRAVRTGCVYRSLDQTWSHFRHILCNTTLTSSLSQFLVPVGVFFKWGLGSPMGTWGGSQQKGDYFIFTAIPSISNRMTRTIFGHWSKNGGPSDKISSNGSAKSNLYKFRGSLTWMRTAGLSHMGQDWYDDWLSVNGSDLKSHVTHFTALIDCKSIQNTFKL